ncbi:MAG: alkaline phosphatase family protein [Alphaproteobacteria bacterium]|nr:alkaline phosphatase family protein [Alphaproteobacteria bacterium]
MIPSITSFRTRLADLMAAEAACKRPRDIVVLAIDGIPYALAADIWAADIRGDDIRGDDIQGDDIRGDRLWGDGGLEPMRSVFPTTSSTAWLSALTGLGVDTHGIPGVRFALPSQGMIDVFTHRGPLEVPPMETIFHDAWRNGYHPRAIVGDWSPLDCSYRDVLLAGAEPVRGYTFYAGGAEPSPDLVADRLTGAVSVARRQAAGPVLVWCFVDVDQYIHRHGYDGHVTAVLHTVGRLARDWAADGMLVVAHSDHGLVPTCHDPVLARGLTRLADNFGAALGGAGRTRWFHAPDRVLGQLQEALAEMLPDDVDLFAADQLFAPGSRARGRVGDLVVVARGSNFLAPDGYLYEHGSLTEAECVVPFALWSPEAGSLANRRRHGVGSARETTE